jgi:CheY-like chemotaxis protein
VPGRPEGDHFLAPLAAGLVTDAPPRAWTGSNDLPNQAVLCRSDQAQKLRTAWAMSQAGLILLIDDEAQVADLLRDYFEEQGYSVMSALNGRDALVLASLTRPDAVLLDIRMPGMQGPDVLAELRKLDDSIPVVMVSGTDDEELARELLEAGAFDYVRKPFMFDALDTIVRLAVLVGRREPAREVEPPPAAAAWSAGDDADHVGAGCARCQAPIAPADRTAVRERNAMYHAACWLERSVDEVASTRRQLAGR